MPRPRLWRPFIVVASYVFYASASWRFCVLLAGVTVGNLAIWLGLACAVTCVALYWTAMIRSMRRGPHPGCSRRSSQIAASSSGRIW